MPLSKTGREILLEQLVQLEENKVEVLDSVRTRGITVLEDFRQLIDRYIEQLSDLIQRSNTVETAEDDILPFVTTGSTVEVQDIDTKEVKTFRIVHPFEPVTQMGDASFLSPVGKALLLSRVGELVTVASPAGTFAFRVQSIRLANRQGNASPGRHIG